MKYSGIKKVVISDGITSFELSALNPAGTSYKEKITGGNDFDGKLRPVYREKVMQISSFKFEDYDNLYDWMTSHHGINFAVIYAADGSTQNWSNPTKILVKKNFNRARRATMDVLFRIKEKI